MQFTLGTSNKATEHCNHMSARKIVRRLIVVIAFRAK